MNNSLVNLLKPQHAGNGHFTGKPGPAAGPRMFGGQAIAQALMAASLEEDGERLAHSLHCYFLKAGHADKPVDYLVTHLTSGRSFSTRRVEAMQEETVIFSMIASFQTPEIGFMHQDDARDVPHVDQASAALESWLQQNEDSPIRTMIDRMTQRPIEIIPLDPSALWGNAPQEPKAGAWMRMREPAHAGPQMNRALLSYASDMLFLRNAMMPHGLRPGSRQVQAASLDHAIWLHETPDFDQWHLFQMDSPWAGAARGLNRGHFYTQDGRMVATVSQESLMRPHGKARERLTDQELLPSAPAVDR